MTWLSILKLVLTIADRLSRMVHDENLMTAGENRYVAKQLAEIQERLRITDQVIAEVNAMSPDQVRDKLREDARD